jgi:hypothetical protein
MAITRNREPITHHNIRSDVYTVELVERPYPSTQCRQDSEQEGAGAP